MTSGRRRFLQSALAVATAASSQAHSKPAGGRLGLPGPYKGRVVSIEHSHSIVNGVYQPGPIQQIVDRGMMELTGAPAPADAWRTFFHKSDVVGIKVNPVGGAHLSSDASVLHTIIDGLKQAGIPPTNVIVYNRYRREFMEAGIHKWLPPGVRMMFASEEWNDQQLDMGGYDPKHFMEIALIKPGEDPADPRFRRSYVAKFVTQHVNKIINLPLVKHHQSAGVTCTLKNMSHGFVNNVNRSHMTPTLNACGTFILLWSTCPSFDRR